MKKAYFCGMDNSFIEHPFVEATAAQLSPEQMDMVWADGWRHFGTHFFRSKLDFYEPLQQWLSIVPLRINLEKFTFKKHQLKLLKKNKNSKIVYKPIEINDSHLQLFEKHRQRFTFNVPSALSDFLGETPGTIPCNTLECCLSDETDYSYASSFFDLGKESISSVYAFFDTDYATFSPGLHTLLCEILYAQQSQKKYVYLGYCHAEVTHYEYKKNFNGLEYYDWYGQWMDFDNLKK